MATQIDLPLFLGVSEGPPPTELVCGRLPLERCLGAGALGITWRSFLPDGTAVAVKRLNASGRDLSSALEQLQRLEALGGKANVVDVLSTFQEDGHLWAASRLDDGVHLGRLIEWRRMHPVTAVAVGAAVLEALDSLHQAGVWHGAVHSRNVHVGRDGTVRLGDYGFAHEPLGAPGAALRAADVRAAAVDSSVARDRERPSSLASRFAMSCSIRSR